MGTALLRGAPAVESPTLDYVLVFARERSTFSLVFVCAIRRCELSKGLSVSSFVAFQRPEPKQTGARQSFCKTRLQRPLLPCPALRR